MTFSHRITKKVETPDHTEDRKEITCLPDDFIDTAFIKQVKNNETVIIPRDLSALSREELAVLYHRYIENIQYMCKRKVRLGTVNDGGWDICDDNRFRPTPPCLVYSFGINNDFTFDDAIANMYGCDVHSFDPSMNVDDHKRGERVYFHAQGISSKNEVTDKDWQLLTFNSLRDKLEHTKSPVSVVKMDIEMYEWLVLPDILRNADHSATANLAVEFHLALSSPEQGRDAYLSALTLLRQVYDKGYRIFWTHQNFYCEFVSKCRKETRTNCHEVSFVKIAAPAQ